ncbi:NADPH-dependent F420 reductase [Streptomyces spiralis]|uniref:NADPH-dependent F420 reductase n=1 Tax=Streptomyces spiralis TaxID=66376 RepID=UPI0033EF5578
MTSYKIAVLGGTGPQGKGLAYRFAQAGHTVVIGSRAAERADATAREIDARIGGTSAVTGASNEDAAASAELVLLATPYEGHAEMLSELAPYLSGKTLISCVNPLGFDKRGAYGLDIADGSAGEEAARIVPDARVVGAFHHVSAVNLWESDGPLSHEDVLVCGDDKEAKQVVVELARAVTGRPGIDVGALRLARHLEPFTAVLIGINRRYKVRSGLLIGNFDR